jgi:glutamyl-tRNA reductase
MLQRNFMNIITVGINHKTSAIGIREKFYLQPVERELLLSELKSDPRVAEAFVLSTCNRTEIYASIVDRDSNVLLDAIFKLKKIVFSENLREHFYTLFNEQAVEHLLRVTTGLDSLIIGEKQILGQMKEALECSARLGMMGRQFNILANIVLQTGKKVRRETQIDFGGSSVSWASVMMAQNIFGSLQDKSVLILGSGKMGRLAVQQLNNKGVKQIYIMNRTTEKAQELAQMNGGIAVPFWDMKATLPQVDVCICSASCVHYLIGKDLVESAMAARNGRKLVLIDISVPRNIDPLAAQVENVYLVTVDDLDKVVEENISKRLGAVEQVEKIIAGKKDEFSNALAKIRSIEANLKCVSEASL